MSTRTIIIWDQCGQDSITFYVVDRDVSYLNGIYLNITDTPDALCNELDDIIASPKFVALVAFPIEVIREYPDTKVIVCGFVP